MFAFPFRRCTDLVQVAPQNISTGDEYDFEEIHPEFAYVDKTGILAHVLPTAKHTLPNGVVCQKKLFFSRPRRFGKSMALSTVQHMLQQIPKPHESDPESVERWRETVVRNRAWYSARLENDADDPVCAVSTDWRAIDANAEWQSGLRDEELWWRLFSDLQVGKLRLAHREWAKYSLAPRAVLKLDFSGLDSDLNY